MNAVALHPRPRWGAAFRTQFATVGAGLRRELLAAAVVILGLTAFTVLARSDGGWTAPIRMDPDAWGFVLALVAVVAPLAIWKGEGPSNRQYLWSLPLARGPLTLVRVLSGWAWLMLVVAALLVWVTVLAWITGGGLGIDEVRLVLEPGAAAGTAAVPPAGAGGGAVDPALLREIRWTTPGWLWLVPFVAPTVTYLLATIAVLRSDHPWIWLVAPLLLFMLIEVAAELSNAWGLIEQLGLFVEGPYGLEALVTGSNESARRIATTAGDQVLVWRNLAELRQWLATVTIWGVPALAGVLLAAFRHQER
jgi:hypothetical protein